MSRSGFQVGEIYRINGLKRREFEVVAVRPDPKNSNFDLVDYRWVDRESGNVEGWQAEQGESLHYDLVQYTINEVPHLLDEIQDR